jgi:hypothetical protein
MIADMAAPLLPTPDEHCAGVLRADVKMAGNSFVASAVRFVRNDATKHFTVRSTRVPRCRACSTSTGTDLSFLTLHRHADQDQLLADLGDKVIRPAELKVLELRG